MRKRGIYYKLIESQVQKNVSPNDANDFLVPLDAVQNESSTIGSLRLPKNEINIQALGTAVTKRPRDESREIERDISIWMMLRMSKPEWKYIAIGGIGSFILGLSAPIYAIVFGEIMGLLHQPLQENVQRQNNLLALVVSNSLLS